MKRMLSADELITHMKSKGITFKITSEEDAKKFLMHNNYYLKLAAYRANYEKHQIGKRAGKYIKLDFGYLQELSRIDMHLRYLIIKMCLDIEHAIKVKLLNEISNNPNEDGYEVMKKFLSKENNMKVLDSIKRHKTGEYCKDLIQKYYPYFPAWVFVELISFGELLHFCSFYQDEYKVDIINTNLMNVVRDIRNAAAHSNCLINKLSEKNDESKQPHNEITEYIKKINNIGRDSRQKYLNTRFCYSFVTLLYIYDKHVAAETKKNRYEELKKFMEERVIRHKEYFKTNSRIVGVYNFTKKVIDNL